MTTHTAFVIPEDFDTPPRTFEYENDDELYARLFVELSAEIVDKTPDLDTPYGPVRVWVDDMAMVRPEPRAVNVRATAIAEGSGYPGTIAGTAVITGPYDVNAGGWSGVNTDHLIGLTWVCDEMVRMEKRAARLEATKAKIDPLARELARAIDAHDRDEVSRILGELMKVDPAANLAARLTLAAFNSTLLPDD